MNDFLPMTPSEIRERGWEAPDVVFVSGDAYVDHPSFGAAILGRWLEFHGYKVALLSQPDWRSPDAWRAFGRPRLCYAVSAGAMDSMINHYTASRKRRNADAYSPGGSIGLRPDRAASVYVQRCREAFKGVPVIVGGVEASMRRVAHYDYWSDTVMPSMLVRSKAHLLAYGTGERSLLEIVQRLASGEAIEDLRDIRGVAYLLGKKEGVPQHEWESAATDRHDVALPSFEEVKHDKQAFARATRLFHRETNPRNARRLLQLQGDRMLVVNPPALPMSEAEMDAAHDLPYQRTAHPSYGKAVEIPAWQTIRNSVQVMRGCFGGCSFCSITLHQGREIQSRSRESILREVEEIASRPDFKGEISDIGGPTANMWRMGCGDKSVEARCRRSSCIFPKRCTLLNTDHGPLVQLMKEARQVPGVRQVRVSSGIRMDLAEGEDEYLRALAAHHVGGQLKVAPEHVSQRVLSQMKKTSAEHFERFEKNFHAASKAAGKEQYLIPYFMASHPGSGQAEAIELAVYLKRKGYRPRQVQDFIPVPMDVATCMYYTGLDPETMKPVTTARRVSERAEQRALLQYFKPENHATVKSVLERAGRRDLIGDGPDCLIAARPARKPIAIAQRDASRRPRKAGYRRAARDGAERDRDN